MLVWLRYEQLTVELHRRCDDFQFFCNDCLLAENTNVSQNALHCLLLYLVHKLYSRNALKEIIKWQRVGNEDKPYVVKILQIMRICN